MPWLDSDIKKKKGLEDSKLNAKNVCVCFLGLLTLVTIDIIDTSTWKVLLIAYTKKDTEFQIKKKLHFTAAKVRERGWVRGFNCLHWVYFDSKK